MILFILGEHFTEPCSYYGKIFQKSVNYFWEHIMTAQLFSNSFKKSKISKIFYLDTQRFKKQQLDIMDGFQGYIQELIFLNIPGMLCA